MKLVMKIVSLSLSLSLSFCVSLCLCLCLSLSPISISSFSSKSRNRGKLSTRKYSRRRENSVQFFKDKKSQLKGNYEYFADIAYIKWLKETINKKTKPPEQSPSIKLSMTFYRENLPLRVLVAKHKKHKVWMKLCKYLSSRNNYIVSLCKIWPPCSHVFLTHRVRLSFY